MGSSIFIDHFSVRRGTFTLQPVTLNIEAGEIFALLGRTGSGKTVLLEAASGMFPGDEGAIYYDGTDIAKIPPERRRIGFVTQDHGLFPHMKVADNIAYGLKMQGATKKEQTEKTEELMEMLSITKIRDQYPGTLSGGESQRTALARALAVNPQTLLLDEPFSALDWATQQVLYEELLTIHRRFHCTIFFVTHNFNEARRLAHRVGILLDGRLEAVTEASRLMEGHYSPAVEEFLGRTPKENQEEL